MADSAKAAAEAAAAKAAARFIQEVWGLQGTAYLIVAIRYYARIKNVGWGGLDWDDGLMVLATVSLSDYPLLLFPIFFYYPSARPAAK